MFDIDKELEKLDEAFSMSTEMNVDELRRLYYARINIYVMPNGDGDLTYSDESGKDLPVSMRCHAVNDIVAKKVKSNELYGVVFRVRKSSGRFVEDIKEYESRDFLQDLSLLRKLDYLDQEVLNDYSTKIKNNGIIKHYFGKFWKLTEMLAESTGKTKTAIWRKILLDLGYIGFNDASGVGFFSNKKQPTAIVLDRSDVEFLDVIPLQKKIRDKRNRVIDHGQRQNKKLEVNRKRVAKAEPSKRTDDSFLTKLVKSVIGG